MAEQPPRSAGAIDFHCHVASPMCFPPSFRAGVVQNMAAVLHARGLSLSTAKLASLHAATLEDPLCDELVAQMDAAEIRRAVLLVPDFTYTLRDATHTIEELIEHHRAVQERHPERFHVLVGVDPRWGRDGLAIFERAISELGFDGMKLYPPCGYRLDDKALWPFYELCSEHGLPVLTHIGPTSPALDFTFARPIFVEAAARAFPRVDFVLAHGSVHYPQDCAMLCKHRPNVYLDVSGYQAADVSELRWLLSRGINHKILFGTDWPVFRLQGRQEDFVARLEPGRALPDAFAPLERAWFLRENAERLLAKRRIHERPGAARRASRA